MMMRIVAFCARRPLVVIGVALVAVALSYFAERSLVRDVIPDLSDPQIGVVADWMGHSATEVASKVTQELTGALQGVPGSTAVRGSSMSGMAYVDVLFGSESALHGGRAEIAARIEKLRPRLPENVRIEVGPEASSTGWIYEYALVPRKDRKPMSMTEQLQDKPSSLLPLRRFQDDVLRPALSAIPGVAEVASIGGETEQVQIETSADQLHAAGAAFSDVVSAVRSTLAAPHPSLQKLKSTVVPLPRGERAPLLLKDVASVRLLPDMEGGMADVDGALPVVGGIVIARRGADATKIIGQVKQVLERYRTRLPGGAKLGIVYDRSELTGRIGHTLLRAVGEEVAVVALVVLVFLLHVRSALVPMLTLPLVVLLTFASMRMLGIPATIMSLGGIAIALGMAVDADLVALEACHRRSEVEPGGSRGERRAGLVAAAGSLIPAILTSLLIAALAFIPVFAFGGETGRLLRPLAASKTLVILGAAIVTLTIAPAVRDRLLGGRIVPELKNPLVRGLLRMYRPFVEFALRRPAFTIATAALLVISCLPIIPRIGSEFLPRVDEGDLLFMPTTRPGASPGETAEDFARQDLALASRPEIALVFGKVGRADTATDPAPLSMAETSIRLKPRAEWPKMARPRWYSSWAPGPVKRVLGLVWPEEVTPTTAELVDSLDHMMLFPGWTNAFTAPVRARMDMMSTGIHTPVGIRIVARDPARVDELGAAAQAAALQVPGTRSAIYESLGGETRLSFAPDADALARHHVDPALARSIADLLLTGGQVGELDADDIPNSDRLDPASLPGAGGGPTKMAGFEIDPGASGSPAAHERLRVRLSLEPPWLATPLQPADLLRNATVRANDGEGQPVALGLLGRAKYADVPAMLHSEQGELVGYVHIDLQNGVDLAGYVERARDAVERALSSGEPRLGPGERIEWTGQYEPLSAGQRRLAIIAPIVAVSMLGLLLLQFRSLTEALIVLASVPFALVGSFWTLYLFDYRFSAPVWVGLLSVVGLAMQTGVLMVVYIDEAFHRRLRAGLIRNRDDIIAAHAEGTVRRLRPKLMTITTMAAGLLPLVWADGAGAEIMRRVAAPMIGGLATSAFLTLEVIPVFYTIWRYRQLSRAQRTGEPLENVVGTAPAWARA